MKSLGINAFSAVVCIVCAHAMPSQNYDGNWWLSIDKDQKIGFLSGYADCVIYDVHKSGLNHFSAVNEESRLSKYYLDHSNMRSMEVESLLWKLWAGSKPISYPPKGETYKGKHGFFDGDYWRQATPNHRLGFIKGYLYCQKKYSKPMGIFTNSPEWYVDQISKWYGMKSADSDEIDESKLDEKIAHVLYSLKDKRRNSEPAK